VTRKRRHPNVSMYRDRHGKVRWRWRKSGFPTYTFKNPPDTPGFKEELELCQSGLAWAVKEGSRTIPRSVNDLVSRYYGSADFNGGGADDQRRRRLLIESFRNEFGDDLVANFGFEHIEAILLARSKKREVNGRTLGGPVAAQNLRKQLLRLFAYARRLGWITANPVSEAQRLKVPKTTGYHTWSETEIARYQERHPLGTRARLALEIMLWTWARRGDARLFGPEHMREGKLVYRQGKTGKELTLVAVPQLLEAINAMQRVGIKTYLVTDFGKPFSRAGFGNKMREWCDEAGLPHCTAHGLRKAAARRAAEIGATQRQLKAVGGWSGDQEVSTYTAAADQERLAEAALIRISAADLANRESKLANPNAQGPDNAS
jgi:integrase